MKTHNYTRRDFLKSTGIGAAAMMLPSCAFGKRRAGGPVKGKRPNIIVIVSDDMGYVDLGCYGGKDIPTPQVDSIAAKGIRFTNGYVSCPVCSPTRAGLITGRYQQRFGYYTNGHSRIGLPLTEVTIANVLKAAGYVTGAVGKWHLGMSPDFHPLKRGFDEFFGFLGGAHSYIEPGVGSSNPIMRGTKPVNEKEYLTDAFSREAVSFVERHRDKPFFLYLAYNAVHAPMQSPERYQRRFQHIEDPKRRIYAGMLTALDEGIGKVLAKLREFGLEEDTLLFFVNDNGGAAGNASRNDPLQNRKGTMFEGGIRVPFIIQWPRRLGGRQTYDHPVAALDILPTAAAAARGDVPTDRKIDGKNLLPYVTGSKKKSPHDTLYWWMGSNYATRKGNWKLTHQGGESKLFDLASDISESRDLAAEQPDVLKEMEKTFARWSSQMSEPLSQPKKRKKRKKPRKKT